MVAEPGANVQSMRPGFDLPRIERAVHEILEAIGEDPGREGLKGTPRRVARAFAESFSGLHQDPAEIVSVVFDEKHDEMVLIKDIEVASTCEHCDVIDRTSDSISQGSED